MSFGMKTFYNGTSFDRREIPMPDNDTFFQGVMAVSYTHLTLPTIYSV